MDNWMHGFIIIYLAVSYMSETLRQEGCTGLNVIEEFSFPLNNGEDLNQAE